MGSSTEACIEGLNAKLVAITQGYEDHIAIVSLSVTAAAHIANLASDHSTASVLVEQVGEDLAEMVGRLVAEGLVRGRAKP